MSAAAASKSPVCLLDDDPAFLQAIGRLLSSADLTVEQFLDPHAFLEYARMHQPAVAVIDIYMPIMNGLEVQARLRTASPSTRVVVLTAKDDHSTRTKAMAGGASAFFLKAGSEQKLLAGVVALIAGP